jgi:transposase InsO family protein
MYLAVIIDLYSRKVVGWSLRERMTTELICEALHAAVRARSPADASCSTATGEANTRARRSAAACSGTAWSRE